MSTIGDLTAATSIPDTYLIPLSDGATPETYYKGTIANIRSAGTMWSQGVSSDLTLTTELVPYTIDLASWQTRESWGSGITADYANDRWLLDKGKWKVLWNLSIQVSSGSGDTTQSIATLLDVGGSPLTQTASYIFTQNATAAGEYQLIAGQAIISVASDSTAVKLVTFRPIAAGGTMIYSIAIGNVILEKVKQVS